MSSCLFTDLLSFRGEWEEVHSIFTNEPKAVFLPKPASGSMQVTVLSGEKGGLRACLEPAAAWQMVPFVLLGHPSGRGNRAFPFISGQHVAQISNRWKGEEWVLHPAASLRQTCLC